KEIARLSFVVDQNRHDVGNFLREFFFALTKRDLVRNLVEIALGLRAFAVEAADGEVDLLQAAEDFVDLPSDHEGRQVEHYADAKAGADVRGTGRQVAETIVVCVRNAGFDQVVELVDLLPSGTKVQAAFEDLDAQMVLFVDHDACLLALIEKNGAGSLRVG